MAYSLEYAPGFERRLVRFLKLHPELKSRIGKTLKLLVADLNCPSLETHKLKGKLSDKYGCSINYHYRLVFKITENRIQIISIGSHDDVY
jgi:addiction module RelE/StbE family toxin